VVGIEPLGIGEVRSAYSLSQYALALWHDHEMDVIGHQAVSDYPKPALGGLMLQYLQVGDAIRVNEEDFLPIVPALGDVMGQARENDACDSRHDTGYRKTAVGSRNR
jgi:hypothetical protein